MLGETRQWNGCFSRSSLESPTSCNKKRRTSIWLIESWWIMIYLRITIYINNMNRKWQCAAHAPPKSLRLFSATLHSRIAGLILTMFKYVCREASSWVRGCFFLCRANGSFISSISDFTDLSNVTFLTFRKARHMEFAIDFTSFHCMHCMLARHKRVKIMLGWAINNVDWPSWSDSKKNGQSLDPILEIILVFLAFYPGPLEVILGHRYQSCLLQLSSTVARDLFTLLPACSNHLETHFTYFTYLHDLHIHMYNIHFCYPCPPKSHEFALKLVDSSLSTSDIKKT